MSDVASNAGLFVYGSLVDEERRLEVIERRVETLRATLKNYACARARYYYIVKRPGTDTPGLILLKLTPRDFALLDRYEDVPRLYTRVEIEVVDEEGTALPCWIYMPTERVTES